MELRFEGLGAMKIHNVVFWGYGTVQSGKWVQCLGGICRRGGSVGVYSNTVRTIVSCTAQQGVAEIRNGEVMASC